MGALRAGRVYRLHKSEPTWRIYAFLRTATLLFSILTIICFAVLVAWNARETPNYAGWKWASWDLQWCLFVPGTLSIVWSIATVAKLFLTTKFIASGADIGVELVIATFGVFTVVYVASVSGPMQWWIDGQIFRSSVTYAGAWETTGIVALILLLVLHLGFFVWAWRRNFAQAETEVDSLKGPLAVRRSDSLKDVKINVEEVDFGRWLENHDDPPKVPKVKTKEEEVFELPMHMTTSRQHIARYGNSWEVATINRF